ncbi:MAG: hypothetical protein J6B24_09595 [Clostridia bacterium]|nr:hypothetical protein [Clostridia bacterium]
MNHQDNNNKPRAPISDKAKTWGLILPVLLLCVGFLAGLCWFLRPAASETEKRELTEFPTFTVESFLSGEFTDQVSLWYADTFPGREGFIKAYHGIQSLFGLRGEQFQQGDMGDDIPDGPMDPNTPVDRPTNGGEGGEQVGGYYLVGDTAYELYSFSQANAQTYASLMNKAAVTLEGKANVYDLIIPLHYSFALSAEVQDQHKLPDADQAIRYMYSGMNEDVHTVNAYAALMAHKDEYIYFRTDHHWTATGAYYAYEAYCQAAGITPTPLSSYEKLTFGGFLGTLYSKTGQPAAMGNNPDSVEAYIPKGTNDEYIYNEDGGDRTRYRGGVVRRDTDTVYQAAASKYNCFLMGDHPLIEIHNENVSADRKGTTVLLVKESFGNAFAPFLVDSYEYIYVVDYRYYKGGTLGQLVADKGVDDVIFLNNVVAATGGARLSEMEDFIG